MELIESEPGGVLVSWYRRERKSLPWREDAGPYRVWIAEVMSQQTSLSVIIPRFERFVAELPNLRALAECEDEHLRELWSGLGYYARARNLRRGARYMSDQLGGQFPQTYAEWRKVPGCGPYTAAVIASVCYDERVPSIDGNAVRVVSRLLDLRKDVWAASGRRTIESFLEKTMGEAISPGDFNQALMELGQERCTKHHPACPRCPLRPSCLAATRGSVDVCPPPRPRPPTIAVGLVVVVLTGPSQETVAIGKRNRGFLAGTTGFPLLVSGTAEEEAATKYLRSNSNNRVVKTSDSIAHTITRHRIRASVFVASLDDEAVGGLAELLGTDTLAWVDTDRVASKLASSLDRKAWKIVIDTIEKGGEKSWEKSR